MLNEFYECLLSEPPTILGLKLRPFGLGHTAILQAIESPMVTGARVPTWHEVLILLNVCSRSFEEAKAWIWKLPEWKMEDQLGDIAKKYPDADIPTVIATINRYIEIFSRPPKYKHIESGRPIKAPDTLGYVSGLIRQCRMTKSEAWNTSRAEAVWLLITCSGQDHLLITDEEDALAKRISIIPVDQIIGKSFEEAARIIQRN